MIRAPANRTTSTAPRPVDDSHSDDEPLHLPPDTLALLSHFHTERDAQTTRFNDLSARAEAAFSSVSTNNDGASRACPPDADNAAAAAATTAALSIDLFPEDWNQSQFWYTDASADALATALLSAADNTPDAAATPATIVVISAPSVYIALRRRLQAASAARARPHVYLLEYDARFRVLGPSFVPYDYARPLQLPAWLQGAADVVFADPPFLSAECQGKTAETARFVAREWTPDGVRMVTCTGERMGEVVLSEYRGVGVRETGFEPEHANGLGNAFRCFANFSVGGGELRR